MRFVPQECDGLFSDLLNGPVGVVIAVGAGKDEYAKFHWFNKILAWQKQRRVSSPALAESSAPAETDAELHLGRFEQNQFSCSLNDVRNYLGSFARVHFHQGLFPATGRAVEQEKFSFVHSDVDLYASTQSVLEFFYPRLVPGGIILTHDFATCHGPHQAFTEFFADRPEPLIELPGDQAMVVKL